MSDTPPVPGEAAPPADSPWAVPAPGQTWSIPGPTAAPGLPLGAPLAPSGPSPGPGSGWAPPARAPEPTRQGRRLTIPAVIASVGLGLAALVAVGASGAIRDRADRTQGFTFESLASMSPGEQAAIFASLDEADAVVAGWMGAYGGLTFLIGIAWIIWQRRFVRNAMPFGQVAPKLGWGTWGWIVPIANLYLPEAQLASAARISDPVRLRTGRSGAASPVVYLWWGCYSAASILQLGSSWTQPSTYAVTTGQAQVSDFRRADQIAAMGFGLGAVAAVLAAATVVVCTRRQKAMLAPLGVHV